MKNLKIQRKLKNKKTIEKEKYLTNLHQSLDEEERP